MNPLSLLLMPIAFTVTDRSTFGHFMLLFVSLLLGSLTATTILGVLLEAVAADVAVGVCDASLTPSVITEAVQSIPCLADKDVFDMLATLISLLPVGYVRQLTGIGAGK